MPRVSIITPTRGRPHFLRTLWGCIQAQSFQDWEWCVHDSGEEEAPLFAEIKDNPRVFYNCEREPMTIGAKRNALCAEATGEIIAHFDDDDFYGPRYLDGMLSFMTDQNVDFVKLFGFFLYHLDQKHFAYWDLERDFPLTYCLPTSSPLDIVYNRRTGVLARWGYGFSYVYHRRVWEQVRFPEIDHPEDQIFANTVVTHFKAGGKQDFTRSCLHLIHGGNIQNPNTSFCFPQQILPNNRLLQAFPDFPLAAFAAITSAPPPYVDRDY